MKNKIVLIGAGIMSATLGIILKMLHPQAIIEIYERLDDAALESSDAWNNAGTGHSAFCELNYTPEHEDGTVDAKKAIAIAEQFELSRQFWSYLVERKYLANPKNFIHSVPHLSFVWGEKNSAYLQNRFVALQSNPLFDAMEFSTNFEVLKTWMPLVMTNRVATEAVAATKMEFGTDVNFGQLTRELFLFLSKQNNVSITYNTEIKKLRQREDGSWRLKIKDLQTSEIAKTSADFVFIGAGGGSLLLLEKANVKEGEGYGGFPVSGQWLKCNNQKIIDQHHTKVYGKASVGAPPMSVPHLDTRIIDGKKELLFGPFAGFSTKFLKNGSYLDLLKSIELDNILPMLSAGLHNISLTKYLVQQVLQSPEDRLNALKEYFPNAKIEDWELLQAGQRVQVIKKDEKEGGILEFGTEVITTADGTLAALLGASPGASTAVHAMLDLVERCFEKEFLSPEWQNKIKEMIPSFGKSLNENPTMCQEIRQKCNEILNLTQA